MDRGLNDIQNPSKQIVTDTKSANAHLESMWNYRNVKRETIPEGELLEARFKTWKFKLKNGYFLSFFHEKKNQIEKTVIFRVTFHEKKSN